MVIKKVALYLRKSREEEHESREETLANFIAHLEFEERNRKKLLSSP